MIRIFFVIFLIGIVIVSCKEKEEPLPIIGRIQVIDGDTLFHSIPDFEFINQDSQSVNNKTLEPFIYISDFFFMSCPSICPKVKKQMLRIYDKYEGHPMLKIVSHTIDPKRDTPERLKQYANNLDVNTSQWIFLTGIKDSLLGIADDYFIVAYEDADSPGGFDHSGKIILVDTKRHIRAFAEGTDPEDVDLFMRKIDNLLSEYEAVQ